MGRNGTLEQEVKFEAPIALALPDLRPLVGGSVRLPEEQQVSRYFDTVDHRLWRQGMTLRHRSTSDRGRWHLDAEVASAFARDRPCDEPRSRGPDRATRCLLMHWHSCAAWSGTRRCVP